MKLYEQLVVYQMCIKPLVKIITVARRLFGIPVDYHPTEPPDMVISRPQRECRINGLWSAVCTILTKEYFFYLIFRWRRNEEKMVFHWKTGKHFCLFILCGNCIKLKLSCGLCHTFVMYLHIHDSQQFQMKRRKRHLNHLTLLDQTVVRESHTSIQQKKKKKKGLFTVV